MRRGEFISLKAYVIAGCFAIITPADFAHAQPKKPTATEDTLAAKIKCQHFQKKLHRALEWVIFSQLRLPDCC